jgi:hypothetical protein
MGHQLMVPGFMGWHSRYLDVFLVPGTGSCVRVFIEVIECAMGVTPGVADPLLKVALPGNLDERDGAPEEDNCKLGLMYSENGDEKLFADWSRLLSKSCAVPNVYQTGLVSFITELGTRSEDKNHRQITYFKCAGKSLKSGPKRLLN